MYEIDKINFLQIGVQGENIARKIEIDMTKWVEELEEDGVSGYTFGLIFKPYNDPDKYPMVTTYDNETHVLTWRVSSAATQVSGVGYTEVRAQESESGLVKKTRIIPTAVEDSVSGNEVEPPEPQEEWVTAVLNAGEAAVEANEAAQEAKTAAEDARDAAQAAAGNFQDLSASVTGLAAGTSPTVDVTHSEGGYYNLAFGIPKGDKGDTGDPAPAEQVVPAVDDWLDEHITNPSNPPLDTSLSLSNAAAPANLVGDLKVALGDGLFVNDMLTGYFLNDAKRDFRIERNHISVTHDGTTGDSTTFKLFSLFGNVGYIGTKVSDIDHTTLPYIQIPYDLSAYDLYIEVSWKTKNASTKNRVYLFTKDGSGNVSQLTLSADSGNQSAYYNICALQPNVIANGNFALVFQSTESASPNKFYYSLSLVRKTDKTLLIENAPADAKATGDIASSLPHYIFDWKVFGKGTTNYPYGWRKGYYSSSDGSRNSDSNVSIRTVNLIYGSFISENDLLAEITPPTGYYVRVAVYDSSDNFVGNLNGENTINIPVKFPLRSDRKYAFSVGLFDNDSGSHLTETFTSSIVLKIYTADGSIYSQSTEKDYIYDSTLEYALKLPEGYRPTGKKTKMIICCHGLSSTVTDSSWGANTVATKFVNAGYAVMDVNQVTTQDWCNPALIKKYIAALKDIVQKYNVEPVFVYGYSMGSLIGLCLSATIPGIKANVISGIRLDFAARYAEATAEQKAIIDENLGFTNGYDAFIASGWCKTAISCTDADNNKICPSQFPPTSFIYGTTDTLTKVESLAKIDEIRRGGTVCISKEYTGDHSSVCSLSAGTSFDDAAEWLATWE